MGKLSIARREKLQVVNGTQPAHNETYRPLHWLCFGPRGLVKLPDEKCEVISPVMS